MIVKSTMPIGMVDNKPHILYSFRRCPYAMRARMALYTASIKVELREIVLRDKPQTLLDISPKGTVPVLLTSDDTVIEESMEIIHWALAQNDPDDWLGGDQEATNALIARNDGPFKRALDRYKYPNRYPDEDCTGAKDDGLAVLANLNVHLERHGYLVSNTPTLADYAIFPFIRQFAHADMDVFMKEPNTKLQKWLEEFKGCDTFKAIMPKFKVWTQGDDPVYLD